MRKISSYDSIFVLVAFGMLDSKAFYLTESIRDVLMNTPVKDSELTLGTVNSIDDYWNVSTHRWLLIEHNSVMNDGFFF